MIANHLKEDTGDRVVPTYLGRNLQRQSISHLRWAPFVSFLVKSIVIFLVIWTPTQNSLTRAYPILPSQMVWLGEVLIILLVPLRLSYSIRRPRHKTSPITWTKLLLFSFILVGLISTLLNHGPLLNAVMGYRSLLQYSIVYFVLATERIDDKYVWLFLKALIVVALLQVPVTFIQMVISYVRFGWIDDDSIFGTFNINQANTLAYFVSIVFLVLLGIWNHYPRYRRRITVILLLLIVPFLAASSRAMLLLMPVIVLWVEREAIFGAWKSKRNFKRMTYLVLGGLILISAALVYLHTRGFGWERLSPSQLLRDSIAINAVGNGGRLTHVIYTYQTLSQMPWGLWVGMGPGMYVSGAGYFLNSPGLRTITDYFGQQLYGSQYYYGMQVWLPEYAGDTFYLRDFSQLTSTLGEWGFLGLVLYASIVFTFLIVGARMHRKATNLPLLRVLGGAVTGTALLSLVTVPIISLWEEKALAFLLWSLAGLMLGYFRTNMKSGMRI